MDHVVRVAEQLPQHLRALRKARGLTQEELGRRLGLGQGRVSAIEKRPESISVVQLLEVLAALDVRLVLRDERDIETGRAAETDGEPW